MLITLTIYRVDFPCYTVTLQREASSLPWRSTQPPRRRRRSFRRSERCGRDAAGTPGPDSGEEGRTITAPDRFTWAKWQGICKTDRHVVVIPLTTHGYKKPRLFKQWAGNGGWESQEAAAEGQEGCAALVLLPRELGAAHPSLAAGRPVCPSMVTEPVRTWLASAN